MDIKLTDLESTRKQFDCTISYDELIPQFEEEIEKFRKKATLPGFRKGKVPINMIKKNYGESIEYDSLEKIATRAFWDYIDKEQKELTIVGSPAIIDLKYKHKEPFTFSIKFDVLPEISDPKYKGLDLEKTKYEIDESLVDDEIKYHRFRNARRDLDGQALDEEYYVTVDLQNLDEEGNILIGESQKDVSVYLGNKQIYPEFLEAFKGIREGETKIVDSTNAEGKPKKVEVKCKKVEKIILHELNKEFFSQVTGKEDIETEEQFRAEIRSELQKIYDGISDRSFRNSVISELLRSNDFEVPESFVDSILESSLRDYQSQLPDKKLPADFDRESFMKERRPDAIRAAKWNILRDKIAEKENVIANEDDYRKIAEQESARYGIPAEKMLEFLRKDGDIGYRIISEKIIDWIAANSNVNEKVELRTADSEKDRIGS